MYILYDYLPSGNSYKIRLLLNQLGIPYQRISVDILKNETHNLDFLTKNPNGRVPVLDINGGYLAESNAILWYLAQQSHFLPQSSFDQAQVLQWMFFEQYSHEPNIATSRYWISILRAEHRYSEQLRLKQEQGYAALDVMEQHLETNAFFVGGAYSIADIALYAYTHVAEEGNFSLSAYPNILRWIEGVESQPGYVSITHEPKNARP